LPCYGGVFGFVLCSTGAGSYGYQCDARDLLFFLGFPGVSALRQIHGSHHDIFVLFFILLTYLFPSGLFPFIIAILPNEYNKTLTQNLYEFQ